MNVHITCDNVLSDINDHSQLCVFYTFFEMSKPGLRGGGGGWEHAQIFRVSLKISLILNFETLL